MPDDVEYQFELFPTASVIQTELFELSTLGTPPAQPASWDDAARWATELG